MNPLDGVLHVVPSPAAVVYVLLRGLQDDVDDDMFGARLGAPLAIDSRWHGPLLEAMVPIPPLEPGDTVWWHPDIIHAVDGANKRSAATSLMYIPATPHCRKNLAYAVACRRAERSGLPPPDFG